MAATDPKQSRSRRVPRSGGKPPLSQAQEMVLKWHGNREKITPDEFIRLYYDGYDNKGEKKWPNAMERQQELVGITVNAAMKTLLWDTLQQAKLPDGSDEQKPIWGKLEHLLTEKGLHALKASLKRRDDKLDQNAVDDFLASAPHAGYLKDATTLLPDVAGALSEYHYRVATFIAERLEHTTLLSEIGDMRREGHTTAPRKQTPPEDPRIIAFRDVFGTEVIDFLDSGAKNRDTTKEKIGKRKGFLGVKDINRLTVIPNSPAIAQKFEMLLGELAESEKKGENFLIEGWEIKGHGHIDSKCALALTKGCEKGTPKGFLAEIRIEGPHMSRAYRNTHDTFECIRIFESRTPESLIAEHRRKERNFELTDSPLIKLDVQLRAALHFLDEHKSDIGVDVKEALPDLFKYKTKKYRLYEADAKELRHVRDMVTKANKMVYDHEMEQCTPEWRELYEGVKRQSEAKAPALSPASANRRA